MSRKSDFGRKTVCLVIDERGIYRTPCEKKRLVKNRRLKKIQKESRRRNAKKGNR